MTDENISLLSEGAPAQRTAERQVNNENISEAATSDVAKTTPEYVTLDDHGCVSLS